MNSFYGGRSGQSFEIKKIFANKVEMLEDLQLRWQSNIGVSDFVFISYGLPGASNDLFEHNQQPDLDTFDHSYNSTLWQKIYTENRKEDIDALTGIETYYVSGNYGLGYKLITSTAGHMPKLSLVTKVIHSYEKPRWSIDNTNLDKPIITIYLPLAQTVSLNKKTNLKASDSPVLEWDITTNGSTYNKYDSNGNAIPDGKDKPILRIGIPPAWDWEIDYSKVSANRDPTFTITDNGYTKTMHIKLPKPWAWEANREVLDADQEPTLSLTDDGNTQTLVLGLPRSQVMDPPEVKLVESTANPDVTLAGTVNRPKLVFSLPRPFQLSNSETEGQDKVYSADYINDLVENIRDQSSWEYW